MRLIVPNLPPGVDHAIQIRSVSGGSFSEWSNRFEFTTIEDNNLPDAPANVTWVVSGDSFYGEWDTITTKNIDGKVVDAGIVRYEIELVGTNASGTPSPVTKVVSVPQTTGTRVNYSLSFESNRALFANPRAVVSIRVRAVDTKNLKSSWSSLTSANNPAPAPVTELQANGFTGGINLRWNPPTDTDLAGFNVYASTDNPGFDPLAPTKVGFSAGTQFTFETSTLGTWYFVVRAVDKFGTESPITRASAAPDSPFGVDTEAPPIPTPQGGTIKVDEATGMVSMDFNWQYLTPPTDLSDFILRYRPAGTVTWEVLTIPSTYDNPTTQALISRLKGSSDYDVQIKARDFFSNESGWSGLTVVPKAILSPPPQPAAPTGASNTQQIQVVHSGNRSTGAAMPSDVVHYEAYASKVSNFVTYDSTTLLGTILAGPAIVGTFTIPASTTGSAQSEDWYVKVIAVNRDGQKSVASSQNIMAVGLISTINIGHAQITSAKIESLEANQITAGTGLFADLTIKSTLTLGTATTEGIIKSYDWDTGLTGYRFSKDNLTIRTGDIRAAALKIQNSPNLMRAAYADFEYMNSYYINPFYDINGQGNAYVTLGAFGSAEDTANAKFGRRYGYWTAFGALDAGIVWFGKTDTDYNVEVEAGAKYIHSIYINNRNTGGGDQPLELRVRGNNGTVFANPVVTTVANQIWTRYEYVFTVPAGVTKAIFGVNKTATAYAANFWFDGNMVERIEAGLEAASPWKPPGSTAIDGGGITTGMIRSSEIVTVNGVDQPMWSINLAGAAQFGDASVRGKLIVGPATGTDAGQSYIASGNYGPTSGWKIDSAGNSTFNSASLRGNISTGTAGGLEILQYVASNPFQGNASWAITEYRLGMDGWIPGFIWASHQPDDPYFAGPEATGSLKLSSPYTGANTQNAAMLNLIGFDNGATYAVLSAKYVELSSRNMRLASLDSTPFDINVLNTNYLQFRNGGNETIAFDFNTDGRNIIRSATPGGALKRLDFSASDIFMAISGIPSSYSLQFSGNLNSRPILGSSGINSAVTFVAGPAIAATNLNGDAFIPVRASAFTVSSDIKFKEHIEPTMGALEMVKQISVYDYEQPHEAGGQHRRDSYEGDGRRKNPRTRGLLAQELEKIAPDFVVISDTDEEESMMVDLYPLLSTALAAIKELNAKVESLESQLKKRS